MKYDLSAVEMLKMLGYDQPTGREWLEKLKRTVHHQLHKFYVGSGQAYLYRAYIEFMELMVD